MIKEKSFYDEAKDWDFSVIKMDEESLTDWDMYEILRQKVNEKSKILDLGTGGGEKILRYFPEVAEIVGTDLSEAMIETACENLKKSGRKNIVFRTMDNFKMDTSNAYFDIVVARHTCIDPVQIFKTLKPGGELIVRGVDMLDCWELKRVFGRGQAFHDKKPISRIDYEAILDAGFVGVELVPIHVREYYKTGEDLLMLLKKVPILQNFSEDSLEEEYIYHEVESDLFQKYIENHKTPQGILLIRRYYGITAKKPL
ncbi:methyltransferase domain-containing protein [Candidatus Saccharibacteria bacterium]|nr:methyltransferase domain-containing protein [Candidatus Saccharibacteria bacterium]